MNSVQVNEEGRKSIKKGALLVYRKNVTQARAEPGDYVEVKYGNETLAYGFYNPNSKIALRIISRDEDTPENVLFKKMERAYKIKRKCGNAFRWVFGEGDLLPGIIVDVFNDIAVVRNAVLGWEKYLCCIYEEIKQKGIENIYVKNTGEGRKKEGLKEWEGLVYGNKQETVIEEGNAVFKVNIACGQKTGFYLDQRDNRVFLEKFVEKGDTVLDVFSYTGGFGIHAAVEGAKVTFVERSEKAAKMIKENLKLNNVDGRVVCTDGIKELKKPTEYDVVILDPPAFAKKRDDLKNAKKMYYKINKNGARKSRNLLVTSSCSYPLTPKDFLGILRFSTRQTKENARLLGGLRGQSADHTVYLPQPETQYLKCAFMVME